MPFTAVKLKPVSGAKQIKSADDAYSFMMHMRLSSLIGRICRRQSRRLALPSHRRIAKLGHGELFERPPTWLLN